MGDEDRGSSGSSTVMMVVGVLGGLLLVTCCGGVVVLGGAFWARSTARDARMEMEMKMERAEMEMQRSQEVIEKANAEMRKKLDSTKLPEVPSLTLPPESGPAPSLSPAFDPPKEEEEKKE